MPVKIPNNSIHLIRETGKKDAEGKAIFTRHVVPPHVPFEFTADEIKQAMKVNPNSLRDPKNESQDVQGQKDPDDIGLGAPVDAAVTKAEVEKNVALKGRNKQAGKGSETGNAIAVEGEEEDEM